MSADGNSGQVRIDYDAEYQGALTKIRDEVDGLAASKATTDALRQRGIAPEPLAAGLRYHRKNDPVTLAIGNTQVTAVMAQDGSREADLVAEGDAWASVLDAYDSVSTEAAADARRELWSRPLVGVACIAWRTDTGRRIVVHGPQSGRLAYGVAVRALKRGVIPVIVLLAGWRLLRHIAAHSSAAASTVALLAAGSALAVATMHPVTSSVGNGPVPRATATVIQPAYPSASPGIARQTGGATASPEPSRPGAGSPSGAVPSPVPPAARDLPALPLLPAPTAPGTLPVVPVPTKPPPVPAPQPTTPAPPPKRRRTKCALGLTLNPLPSLCLLPGG